MLNVEGLIMIFLTKYLNKSAEEFGVLVVGIMILLLFFNTIGQTKNRIFENGGWSYFKI